MRPLLKPSLVCTFASHLPRAKARRIDIGTALGSALCNRKRSLINSFSKRRVNEISDQTGPNAYSFQMTAPEASNPLTTSLSRRLYCRWVPSQNDEASEACLVQGCSYRHLHWIYSSCIPSASCEFFHTCKLVLMSIMPITAPADVSQMPSEVKAAHSSSRFEGPGVRDPQQARVWRNNHTHTIHHSLTIGMYFSGGTRLYRY